MLKLYDGTMSVCAIKVRLGLFEKGIPFESLNIDLRRGDQLNPAYLALNPNGVVPTLDDDGKIITESSVIMHYLEDTHPTPSLLPESPVDRAAMRLWMKRVYDTVHPSIGSLTHATVYRPAFLALNEDTRAERLANIPDPNRRQRFAAVYKDGLAAPIAVASLMPQSHPTSTGCLIWGYLAFGRYLLPKYYSGITRSVNGRISRRLSSIT